VRMTLPLSTRSKSSETDHMSGGESVSPDVFAVRPANRKEAPDLPELVRQFETVSWVRIHFPPPVLPAKLVTCSADITQASPVPQPAGPQPDIPPPEAVVP